MSDTENKLLERLAALENELSGKRKDDGKPVFDKRRATLDPINYFREQGLDVDHLSRHFVANAMGKDCPPQLAAMVQMGPQIAATSNLESLVQSLAETVKGLVDKSKETEIAASVKNTPVDPSKYPTLAAAIKTDPSLLDNEIKSMGKIADSTKVYEQIEAKLAPYAKAFGFKPTPVSENKSGESITSTIGDTKPEFRSANQGLSGAEVPPLIPDSTGVLTEDMNEKLKSAVLKKYNL
jgi:hypothetical protein